MNKFFIVEETEILKERLQTFFFQRGDMLFHFHYDSFSLGEIDQEDPDMILLGLIHSAHSVEKGNKLCREIKSKHKTRPVISIVDETLISSLDLSTELDDFMLSSFNNPELAGRITMLLWKYKKTGNKDIIIIDNLTINLANYNVTVDGISLDLTYKEFELLKFLATHPKRAYTREILLNQVWDIEYYGGARTVDVHIRRLRFKLGKYEHLIQTIRNVGYMFGN